MCSLLCINIVFSVINFIKVENINLWDACHGKLSENWGEVLFNVMMQIGYLYATLQPLIQCPFYIMGIEK